MVYSLDIADQGVGSAVVSTSCEMQLK